MLDYKIILSGLLVYIGAAARNIPANLWRMFKSRLGVTIDAIDIIDRVAFNAIDEWCMGLNKKVLENRSKPENRWNNKLLKNEVVNTVGYGDYCVWHNGCMIWIYKSKTQPTANQDGAAITQSILLLIIGRKANKIKNEIRNLINQHSNPDELIVTNLVQGYGSHRHNITKRSFDSVICDKKQELIDHLDIWKNNKEFYMSHGLSYKTGVLLYGEPGTGKSSLAKCIASYLNMKVLIIDLTVSTIQLQNQFISATGNSVILLEDIDCVMDINREKNSTLNTDKQSKLQLLLNFIDGVTSPSNCVFVATTNRIESLDEALIRPGRFDISLNIGLFNITQAKEMCRLFHVDDEVLTGLQFPIRPAELQNILLGKVLNIKNNIEKEDK